MTPTTLVTGARASLREAAIAAALAPGVATAIIVEGLSDGNSALVDLVGPQIVRIAPGCLCCAGNMILRVTLNRLLRRPPEQLFISLANGAHIDPLRSFLSQAPYDRLLRLDVDMAVGSP